MREGVQFCAAGHLDAFDLGIGDVVEENIGTAQAHQVALLLVGLLEDCDGANSRIELAQLDDFGVGVEGDVEDLDLPLGQPAEVVHVVGTHPQGLPHHIR